MQNAASVTGLRVELTIPGGARYPIVEQIDLALRAGEILGLVGESGGGKSVLSSVFSGLVAPPLRIAAGMIEVGGQRVDPTDEAALRRIRGRQVGMIFQDPMTSLNPIFTIGDQLIETLRYLKALSRGDATRRAIALLEEVGVSRAKERLKALPQELSGGMRQRVVIALALAGDPSVLIADEPTTALDVSVQAQVVELIRSLAERRHMSVLFITHDIALVASLADRVGVLYAGRLVEVGPTAAVLRTPRHPYTAGLIASIPVIGHRSETMQQIEGTVPSLLARTDLCSFAPRCPRASDRCRTEPAPLQADANDALCWHPLELAMPKAAPEASR